MSKLERLLNLTAALLQTGRPLTAEEIRERVPGYPEPGPTFRRAFERDKDDLREMGIPLRTERIEEADPPRDGYRIPKEEYYLDDPGLEPDELAALHLATTAVQFDAGRGMEALWKLGGIVAEPDGEDAGTEVVSLPNDPVVSRLYRAVLDRHVVRFRYNDEIRTVDPLRLDYQRGRWYLQAYDHGRGDDRNFRVDRIDGEIEMLPDQAIERRGPTRPGTRVQPWQLGAADPVEAKLIVDAQQAPWARQHLGPDVGADERGDGAVVFTIAVTNRDAFRSFVLTFLDHAEILEPTELRQDMEAWLAAMAGS